MSQVRAVEKLIERLGKKGAQQFAKQEGTMLSEQTGETLWQKLMDREGKDARVANKAVPIDPVKGDEESLFARAMANDNPNAGRGGPATDVTPRPVQGPEYDPDLAPLNVKQAFPDSLRTGDLDSSLDTSAIPDTDLGLMERLNANKGKLTTGAALGAGTAAWSMLPGAGSEKAEAVIPPADTAGVGSASKTTSISTKAADAATVLGTPEAPAPAARPEYRPAPVRTISPTEEKLSEHWQKRVDSVNEYAKGLPAEQQSDWQSKYAALTKEMESAKDRNQTGQLIETIAQAVTQLAAGAYGLRTGMDMGGLKFSKADWDKRMDGILAEFKAKKEIISEGQQLEDRGNARKFAAKESAQRLVSDAENDLARASDAVSSGNARNKQSADQYNAGEQNKRSTDLLNNAQQEDRDARQHQDRMAEIMASGKIREDLAAGRLGKGQGKSILADLTKQDADLLRREQEVQGAMGILNNKDAKPADLKNAYKSIAKHYPGDPNEMEHELKDNLGGPLGVYRTQNDDITNHRTFADRALKSIELARKGNEVKRNNIRDGLDQAMDSEGINNVSNTPPPSGTIKLKDPQTGVVQEIRREAAQKYIALGAIVVE